MTLRFLHISRLLDRQLTSLRQTGKKAELAALKCEAILVDIRRFGCQAEVVAGKRTRNGEQRIRNCVKYDLGGGYRLVTIRAGCALLIVFAGTHDEADNWIERHRYDDFSPDSMHFRCEPISPAESSPAAGTTGDQDEPATDPYEESLRRRLDEGCLRVVFQGLTARPAAAAQGQP